MIYDAMQLLSGKDICMPIKASFSSNAKMNLLSEGVRTSVQAIQLTVIRFSQIATV